MDVRMIAHDMRTPLNALILSLRAIRLKGGAAVAEEVELAERNAQVVAQMVETLLATSEHGPWSKGPLALEQCLALDVVTSTIDQIAPLASAKSLVLEIGELSALPPLVADCSRLIRVLVNLLSNAIKFTPEGGRIQVDAKHRVNDGHPAIVFSVTDTGPGVSEEYIHKIFEAGVSIAEKGNYSSGLGLAVCKEIVEAHQGRIWVDTAYRPGAKFSFAIPMGLLPTRDSKGRLYKDLPI